MVSNHSIMARRYFDCAQKQILLAESTSVDDTRTHYTAIARQYLVLAEDELTAAKRSVARMLVVNEVAQARESNSASPVAATRTE
jgi:hypothetical protein